MRKKFSRVGIVALSAALAFPIFGGSAQAFSGPASSNTWGCNNSSQRVNFSYHPGDVTTTVYWNNHCNYTERAGAEITDHNGVMTTECFSVPRGQGHIKFQQGYSGYFENIVQC